MSREEKQQETENLRNKLPKVESPSWHGDVLKKTEEHVAREGEKPVDWKEAKKRLRNKTGYLSLLVVLLLVGGCGQYDKPVGHELRVIHGWRVAVDDRLVGTETGEAAMKLLREELRFITKKVPEPYAKKLQAIPIFLDKTHGSKFRGETYHPDRRWLIDHGYSPTLWRCVQVTRADDFCDPERRKKEPYPLLHQLIHGYQDRACGGFESADIVAGWERFKKECKGDHPATLRPREYFLEMSLAFFNIGRADPKTAAELKKKDPETFKLIETCWK